jgi:phosphatidylinositol kinase/protein kinase (PI-3  family)
MSDAFAYKPSTVGTYMAGEPLVTIAAFAPQLQVISSKQRPRKLTIYGSNGAEYMFLLKVNIFKKMLYLQLPIDAINQSCR